VTSRQETKTFAIRDRITGAAIGLAVLCCGAAGSACAQQPYPERAIRIVVAFPPGGATDLLARDIALRLNARWGLELTSGSPEEFAGFLKSEVALYEKVTKKLNVQLD